MADVAFPHRFDHGVEDRHEDQRQDGRGQHAAEHGGADRLPARGARAGRDHQRHDAEDEGEGRHQDRPQPQPRRLHRRVDDLKPLLAPPPGEFDDQDGVLGRKADQHDEADLRIDVDLHAAHPQRRQRAEQRQRHREQHHERHGPALVLRRQDQEDEDDGERRRRSVAIDPALSS